MNRARLLYLGGVIFSVAAFNGCSGDTASPMMAAGGSTATGGTATGGGGSAAVGGTGGTAVGMSGAGGVHVGGGGTGGAAGGTGGAAGGTGGAAGGAGGAHGGAGGAAGGTGGAAGGAGGAHGGAGGAAGGTGGASGGAGGGSGTPSAACSMWCSGANSVVQQCSANNLPAKIATEQMCLTECAASPAASVMCWNMHLGFIVGGQAKGTHCPHAEGATGNGACPELP